MARSTLTRSQKESFRRRKNTFSRKARELENKCNAFVYFVICCNGKYYTYKSVADPSWPPSEDQIVGYPLSSSVHPLRMIIEEVKTHGVAQSSDFDI
jgi:hypothetical protein